MGVCRIELPVTSRDRQRRGQGHRGQTRGNSGWWHQPRAAVRAGHQLQAAVFGYRVNCDPGADAVPVHVVVRLVLVPRGALGGPGLLHQDVIMVEAQLRGGHQRRGNRGYPRVPGQLLDLRYLPPPAEVLGKGARVIGAAGDLGQRSAPGQHDVNRGGRGRDLPCAEDLPDAYDAISGKGGDGLIISKHRLHGCTLATADDMNTAHGHAPSADYELLTAAGHSSVVRCGIADSVHQMTGRLCRRAASMVDGGQVNQVRRPVAWRYVAAVPELTAGLPPIPGLPWESLSHRQVLAELAAGGGCHAGRATGRWRCGPRGEPPSRGCARLTRPIGHSRTCAAGAPAIDGCRGSSWLPAFCQGGRDLNPARRAPWGAAPGRR
jgi:hypothetical protein